LSDQSLAHEPESPRRRLVAEGEVMKIDVTVNVVK
jgi:hypothetical protein